jgi:hypothetical protein
MISKTMTAQAPQIRLLTRPGKACALDLRPFLKRLPAPVVLASCSQPAHGCIEWRNGIVSWLPDDRQYAGVQQAKLTLIVGGHSIAIPLCIDARSMNLPSRSAGIYIHVAPAEAATLQTSQAALADLLPHWLSAQREGSILRR